MKLSMELTPMRLVGVAVGALVLKYIDDEYLDGGGTEFLVDAVTQMNDGIAAAFDGLQPPTYLSSH